MATLTSINYSGVLAEKKGTAPTITESGTILSTPIISNNQIGLGEISNVDSVHIPSTNKTVVVKSPYDSSAKPDGQVATVTGDKISLGSAVKPTGGSDSLAGICIEYEHTENKVVACYRSGAGVSPHQHTMVVGTVSGTSISWGTPAALALNTASSGNYGELSHNSLTWVGGMGGDTTNRLVVAYDHADQVNNGSKIAVLTVSGTTPTQHATTAITSNSLNDISVVYIGGGKVVLYWNQGGNGYSKVGTVTGGGTNTIALGSSTTYSTFLQSQRNKQDAANDGTTADKFVVAYVEGGSGGKGKVRVGTVSGTTISYGTAVEFDGTNGTQAVSLVYHKGAQKYLICYRAGGTTNTVIKSFTVSGTSIANLSSAVEVSSGEQATRAGGNYDPVNKKALFFRAANQSSRASSGAGADLLQSTMTLDLSTGSYFTADLQGNGTSHITALTITESLASGTTQSFYLRNTQGSVAKRFIWSSISNVKWAGTGPSLTTADNSVDVLSFTTFDEGTTWYGKVEGLNF